MDWQKVFLEIEDVLIPHYKFDIYERGLYFYLLSQTRLRGVECSTIPLSNISNKLRCSDWQSRKIIRLLADKGCIELEQTRKGHSVKVFLPSELDISIPEEKKEFINIDEVDFFKNREYIDDLIKRERNSCFYCLASITAENCELDHVVSQLKGGDNSYRNIVASCHKCNTRKQANEASDFIRSLYRQEMLNENEFKGRILALESLGKGELKPEV